jgi:hypothetical protein
MITVARYWGMLFMFVATALRRFPEDPTITWSGWKRKPENVNES